MVLEIELVAESYLSIVTDGNTPGFTTALSELFSISQAFGILICIYLVVSESALVEEIFLSIRTLAFSLGLIYPLSEPFSIFQAFGI